MANSRHRRQKIFVFDTDSRQGGSSENNALTLKYLTSKHFYYQAYPSVKFSATPL
jgi:hypothetical protein